MNLWNLFPEQLVLINKFTMLYLPYMAAMLYGLLIILLIRFAETRVKSAVFIFLSFATSVIIMMTIGPGMGRMLIPSLLILVFLLPVIWLVQELLKKSDKNIFVLSIMVVCGLTYSYSWLVRIYALANS